MKKDSYDPKNDYGAHVRLLNGMLDKTTNHVRHLDVQINILIGLTMATFVFSIQKSTGIAAFAILGFFSAVAAIVGLLAIHPPKFLRKRGQEESLFYNKKISGFSSGKEYERQLFNLLGDQKKLLHHFSLEIYNIYSFYYRPKRYLFNISRVIYLVGIVSFIIILALTI